MTPLPKPQTIAKIGLKVYLSGPITGNRYYIQQFAKAERELREQGYEVFNPAKTYYKDWSWIDYLIYDLQILEKCDAIYFLAGSFAEIVAGPTPNLEEGKTIAFRWYSFGSQIEFCVAQKLGLHIWSEVLTGKGGHSA